MKAVVKMRNSTKTIIFTLIVAGTLVAAFFIFFEKVEVDINLPASTDARRNPFLAAERYLREYNVNTESLARRDVLVNLPSVDDLIFVNRPGGNLPEEREDELFKWIANGGHLVITPDKYWNEKLGRSGNTLLDRLGIRLRTPETPEEDKTENDSGSSEAGDDEPAKMEVQRHFNLIKPEKVYFSFFGVETGEIVMDADRILEVVSDDSPTVFSGDSGPHIVIRRIGEGRLIVLSDNLFLTNRDIGDNDHAWFMNRITGNRDKVWILYNSIMPSFVSILLSRAMVFICMLGIFIVAALFRLNMTIGPLRRVQDFADRNILENLLASGTFIVRHRKMPFLIHRTRNIIEKNITHKNLYFEGKSAEERYELISKWTSIPEEKVRYAFIAEPGNSEDFIRISNLLKQIYFDLLVNNKETEKT